MSETQIPIYKSIIGSCYIHPDDRRYLGKFLKTIARNDAEKTKRIYYEFERETFERKTPADMVIYTTCISSGGARKNRTRRSIKKAHKNHRRTSRRN